MKLFYEPEWLRETTSRHITYSTVLEVSKFLLNNRIGRHYALAKEQPLLQLLEKQKIKHDPIDTAINRALLRTLFPWAYCRFTRYPDEMINWVQVKGIEKLNPYIEKNKGILLAGNHHGPGHMIEYYLAAKGYEVNTLQALVNSDKKRMSHASQDLKKRIHKIFTQEDLTGGLMKTTNSIRTLLSNGKIVIATLDGREGNAIICLDLMGYEHGFRYAMPLIATLAKAAIIPVYTSLRIDGHIEICFDEPFPERDSKQSPQDYAKQMTRDYIYLLHKHMQERPANIKIYRLLRETRFI